jgi:hypothetical protein
VLTSRSFSGTNNFFPNADISIPIGTVILVQLKVPGRSGRTQKPVERQIARFGQLQYIWVSRYNRTLNGGVNLVLDLETLVEEFIKTRLRSFEADTAPDDKTVTAVASKDMGRAAREDQVRAWLGYYKVILFFPPDRSQAIAREIIQFADEPRPASLDQCPGQIVREYNRLRGRIQPVAPPAPRSNRQREVTSLTSKALWLCYPHDVPIFDDYALRALQVISRICRICPAPDQGLYGSFVDVWLQFYDRIKPLIEQSDLQGYIYKVRVFDGFLWYLGKPEFDVAAAFPTLVAVE